MRDATKHAETCDTSEEISTKNSLKVRISKLRRCNRLAGVITSNDKQDVGVKKTIKKRGCKLQVKYFKVIAYYVALNRSYIVTKHLEKLILIFGDAVVLACNLYRYNLAVQIMSSKNRRTLRQRMKMEGEESGCNFRDERAKE